MKYPKKENNGRIEKWKQESTEILEINASVPDTLNIPCTARKYQVLNSGINDMHPFWYSYT